MVVRTSYMMDNGTWFLPDEVFKAQLRWRKLSIGKSNIWLSSSLLPHPAINFLIETGTLLHFPDTSHGLCTLYFLCPVWLSECLERIMHLKSSRSVARNGVIRAEDLRVRLRQHGNHSTQAA